MRGLGFPGMPSIDAIAAEYVDRAAALDPFQAALAGIDGHDHEVPDLSPDGFAERARLERATLAALDGAEARSGCRSPWSATTPVTPPAS
jgi:hypothetical protein